jgi:hypothetical protein
LPINKLAAVANGVHHVARPRSSGTAIIRGAIIVRFLVLLCHAQCREKVTEHEIFRRDFSAIGMRTHVKFSFAMRSFVKVNLS